MIGVVVFPVYNRLAYLAPTVESWRQARKLHQWCPRAFVEPSDKTEQVLKLVKSLVAVPTVNKTRQGLTRNIFQALDKGFELARFVVIAEDDIVVSSDVLEYFEWASDRFADDPSVLGVCAFSSWPDHGPDAVLLQTFGLVPWVWGTWRDRWEREFKPTWDFDYTSGRPDQNNGQAGWDVNITLRVSQGRRWVAPSQSRSDHIGERGAHSTAVSFARRSRPTAFERERPSTAYRLIE